MAGTILKRPQAETDLREIADYIAIDSQETAIRFLHHLNEKIHILENYAKNLFQTYADFLTETI